MNGLYKLINIADSLGNSGENVMYVSNVFYAEIKTDLLSTIDYPTYLNGVSYGSFGNSKEKCLSLGFFSLFIHGVTFHLNTISNFQRHKIK